MKNQVKYDLSHINDHLNKTNHNVYFLFKRSASILMEDNLLSITCFNSTPKDMIDSFLPICEFCNPELLGSAIGCARKLIGRNFILTLPEDSRYPSCTCMSLTYQVFFSKNCGVLLSSDLVELISRKCSDSETKRSQFYVPLNQCAIRKDLCN